MNDTENLDKIQNYMKEQGFMKKGDLDDLVKVTRDFTIQQVLDHQDCNDNNCGICKMKSNIDGTAYERGIKNGIQLQQKFPNEKFVV